jgi:tetratricopeptide (TPR) repeat protein
MAERLRHWLWIFDDELARTLLSVQPDNADVVRRAASHPAVVGAMRRWMQRESREALEELTGAITQGNPDALLLGAQIHFELGNLERAAELYARLEQTSAGHTYASLNRGLCLARLGQWSTAVECLRRAVVLRAESAEAWFVLGICLLNGSNPSEARAAFTQSVKLRGGYVPALVGEAVALQLEGACAEAVGRYERLLEVSPDHEELLANAAQAAAGAKDWERAQRWAAQLVERMPASGAALLVLAECAIEERRFADAAGYCARLAESEPAGFTHWFNLGVCYQRLNQPQDAAFAFDSALRIDQSDAEAWEGLAGSLLANGDRSGAKAAWRLALEHRPGNTEGWLRLGLLHAWDGETEAAEQALSKGRNGGALNAENRPVLADLVAAIATAQHQAGRLERAVGLYQEALGLRPDDAELHFNLGSVLAELGREGDAHEHWKTAVAAKPELARTLLAALTAD